MPRKRKSRGPKIEAPYRKGDVVMAKCIGQPWWPCVVNSVDVRNKLVRLFYLPLSAVDMASRNMFKASFNKVRHFTNDEKLDEKHSKLKEEFYDATVKAKQLLQKPINLRLGSTLSNVTPEPAIKRRKTETEKKDDMELDQNGLELESSDNEEEDRNEEEQCCSSKKVFTNIDPGKKVGKGFEDEDGEKSDSGEKGQNDTKIETEDDNEFPSLETICSPYISGPPFQRGDVTWLKLRRWKAAPAIIIHVDAKRKKATAVFLPIKQFPCDRRGAYKFQATYEKFKPFEEYYAKNYIRCMNDPNLTSAVIQAEDICKKTLDPFKLEISQEIVTPKMVETHDVSLVEDEEEEEEEDFSEETLKQIELRKEKNEPLVKYILKNEMKQYLLDIVQNKVSSQLHDIWMKQQQMNPGYSTVGFGPLCDDEQIDVLVETMLNWYQSVRPDDSIAKACSYVTQVWMIEAIKVALIKTRNYTPEQALAAFGKMPDLLPEERKFLKMEVKPRKMFLE